MAERKDTSERRDPSERRDAFALLSRYNKLYLQRYETKSGINMHGEQWASGNLIKSYELQGCYDLLDYYFSVSESPNWSDFKYLAEKIFRARIDKQKDEKERAERRQMSKEWLSE